MVSCLKGEYIPTHVQYIPTHVDFGGTSVWYHVLRVSTYPHMWTLGAPQCGIMS